VRHRRPFDFCGAITVLGGKCRITQTLVSEGERLLRRGVVPLDQTMEVVLDSMSLVGLLTYDRIKAR
jgi:hypothetical protein